VVTADLSSALWQVKVGALQQIRQPHLVPRRYLRRESVTGELPSHFRQQWQTLFGIIHSHLQFPEWFGSTYLFSCRYLSWL